MAQTCEYCGNFFSKGFETEGQTPTDNEEFCSKECERQEEQFRNAEAAADAEFEEMAYGPQDE